MLSSRLNTEFSKGFSADTLENARKIYVCYRDRKSEAVFRIFDEDVLFTYVTAISWKVPEKPVKSMVLRSRKALTTPLLHHFERVLIRQEKQIKI